MMIIKELNLKTNLIMVINHKNNIMINNLRKETKNRIKRKMIDRIYKE